MFATQSLSDCGRAYQELTYVAVTRAREQLFIPYCSKNNL